MTLGTILLIVVVLMLLGAIPAWPHSRWHVSVKAGALSSGGRCWDSSHGCCCAGPHFGPLRCRWPQPRSRMSTFQ